MRAKGTSASQASTPKSAASSSRDGEGDSSTLEALLHEVARLPRAVPGGEPDLTGRRLAQFLVRERLGQGGMGIVYRAEDTRLRRRVALKVLPTGLVGDDERRRRFLREARSASAVLHPNLATVFDVGEADGTVFIAMEHVDGVTLRATIEANGGRLAAAEAARIVSDVARAVGQAHRAGVIHRDLKPENVMLTRDGTVKVLDFGLAKLTGTPEGEGAVPAVVAATEELASRVGRVLGTPGYMSPEQAAGAAVGPQTDVFALGVVLCEAVSGSRPLDGSFPRERSSSTDRPRPRAHGGPAPDLPASLGEVIQRCLRRRPEDRFADGTALAIALDGVRGELAGAPPRPSRRRWVAIAGVLVAVGATVQIRARLVPLPTPTSSASPADPTAARPGVPPACARASDCPSGSCVTGECRPWSTIFGGAAADSANAIALTSNGDVIVVGHFLRSMDVGCGGLSAEGSLERDAVVMRLGREGHCLWSKRFGGPGSDAADTVVVTPDDHIVVGGIFSGTAAFGGPPLTSAGAEDIVVFALDGTGEPLWSKRFGGADLDRVNGMDVDAAGNILVTGEFRSPRLDFGGRAGRPLINHAPPHGDGYVVKLSPAGEAVWAIGLGTASTKQNDLGAWIAVDPRGDVGVLGFFADTMALGDATLTAAGTTDGFIAKLSGRDGQALWARRFGRPGGAAHEGALVFDPHGDLFLTGEHEGVDLGGGVLPGSVYVAKMSGSGQHLWSRGFGGASRRDVARRLVLDRAGDPVVFGRLLSPSVAFDAFTLENGGGSDLYLARLDRERGAVVAVRSFVATDAPARSLAFHAATNNLVVAGRFVGSVSFGAGTHAGSGEDGYVASLGPPL